MLHFSMLHFGRAKDKALESATLKVDKEIQNETLLQIYSQLR